VDFFIDALLHVVGPAGTLIVPTFSYSYTKKEVFDPRSTPSTVGILPEVFRQLPEAVRSPDPIFSVAALGAERQRYVKVGNNCFGADSVFATLHQRNAKMIFLGNTFDITFMHFVEQTLQVPYRSIKAFTGMSLLASGLQECTYLYNVRPLDATVEYDLEKIARSFTEVGALKSVKLGSSQVRGVTARAAFSAIEAGLRKNPAFLLAEDPGALK
jgi:aminoglycoside 3-N-acetyltransferase